MKKRLSQLKNVVFFGLLSLVLLANRCSSKNDVEHMLLNNTWLHSHEEDTRQDVRVYRPNTYDFPPSRGRTGFTFEPNGVFKQYDIAPTDGLDENIGKWELLKDDKIRITFPEKEPADYEMEIVKVEPGFLKIKRYYKEGQ